MGIMDERNGTRPVKTKGKQVQPSVGKQKKAERENKNKNKNG